MSEQQHCLGVAWLTERPAATAYREEKERPLQGYLMLSSGDEGLRVTVQVDNCRRLSPQEPGQSHIYEAVLLRDSGLATDAGGFNATLAGSASATFLLPACPPSATVRARIDMLTMAGARAPLLEGPVIWLQAPIESERPLVRPAASGAAPAGPAPVGDHAAPTATGTAPGAGPHAVQGPELEDRVLSVHAVPGGPVETAPPSESAAPSTVEAPVLRDDAPAAGEPPPAGPVEGAPAATAADASQPAASGAEGAPHPDRRSENAAPPGQGARHPYETSPYFGAQHSPYPGASPFGPAGPGAPFGFPFPGDPTMAPRYPGPPDWQRMADPSMGVPPLFAAPYHWTYGAKPPGPINPMRPAPPFNPFYRHPFDAEARVSAFAPAPAPSPATDAPAPAEGAPSLAAPGAPQVTPPPVAPVTPQYTAQPVALATPQHTAPPVAQPAAPATPQPAEPVGQGGAPAEPAQPAAEPEPKSQPTRLMLERLHHSAFGASGYGLVDAATGHVEITLRGLPSPSLLGGSLTAYKVWLVSERGRSYLPVGICTKMLADTYRLVAASLPLNRYESVLVTAEENPNYGYPVGVKVMAARL